MHSAGGTGIVTAITLLGLRSDTHANTQARVPQLQLVKGLLSTCRLVREEPRCEELHTKNNPVQLNKELRHNYREKLKSRTMCGGVGIEALC